MWNLSQKFSKVASHRPFDIEPTHTCHTVLRIAGLSLTIVWLSGLAYGQRILKDKKVHFSGKCNDLTILELPGTPPKFEVMSTEECHQRLNSEGFWSWSWSCMHLQTWYRLVVETLQRKQMFNINHIVKTVQTKVIPTSWSAEAHWLGYTKFHVPRYGSVSQASISDGSYNSPMLAFFPCILTQSSMSFWQTFSSICHLFFKL